MSDAPLNESLAALSRFFVGDGTFEDTLQRVTDLTVDAIDGAELAGLTMISEGHKRTAVFTDELAPEIDRAQYESGEGPCIEAFETGEIQTIESTLEDGPWPEFRQAATEHGIRSTLSLPMLVDNALNCIPPTWFPPEAPTSGPFWGESRGRGGDHDGGVGGRGSVRLWFGGGVSSRSLIRKGGSWWRGRRGNGGFIRLFVQGLQRDLPFTPPPSPPPLPL